MPGALDTTGALFHGVTLVGADLSGGNYAGATFYQCDFTEANLSGCDLTGATFNECGLRGTDLSHSSLSCATITRSHADDAVFDGAMGSGLVLQVLTGMARVSFDGARLSELRIRSAGWTEGSAMDAALIGLQLVDVTMFSCDFSGSDLTQATWRSVTGHGNFLRRVQLAGGTWTRCRLPVTDLRGASMENARLLECDLSDSKFSNLDDERGHASFTGRGFTARDCHLARADFTDAYLYRASFTGDPVTGMRMDDAKFTGANLIQAYVAAALPGADLRSAHAAYSRFNQSDLTGADLTGVGLYQSSFVKVVLTGADFTAVSAPFFLDRCKGVADAVMDEDLRRWAITLAEALSTQRNGST